MCDFVGDRHSFAGVEDLTQFTILTQMKLKAANQIFYIKTFNKKVNNKKKIRVIVFEQHYCRSYT